MDVRGVGAGPTGPEWSTALRGLAQPGKDLLATFARQSQSADTITEILRQLSGPEAAKLLENILLPLPQENAARADDLLRASVSAAAEGNVQLALVKLTEFAALDPRRVETLHQEPGLGAIRQEVGELLSRLVSTAHLNAESRMGEATRLLEAAGSRELPGREFNPEIAILIAGRLLEAGGFVNYMRSAELSQIAINQFGIVPTPAPLQAAETRSLPIGDGDSEGLPENRWNARIKQLWRRAPLLVLLLAWLAAGFMAGSVSAILRIFWPPETWPEGFMSAGFEVWGLGFLALVGFGFYMRVRNVRR